MGRNAFPDEDTIEINTRITEDANDILRTLSELTKIPMNRLLDTAVKELGVFYLARHKAPGIRTLLAAGDPLTKKKHADTVRRVVDLDPFLKDLGF